MSENETVTPAYLRSIGFRLDVSHGVDNQPHMTKRLDPRMETAVECSQLACYPNHWTCWLRSDIAHSRSRFVFIRTIQTRSEILKLLRGLSGVEATVEEFDEAQFHQAWLFEEEGAKRRYTEYARGERWGHLPG